MLCGLFRFGTAGSRFRCQPKVTGLFRLVDGTFFARIGRCNHRPPAPVEGRACRFMAQANACAGVRLIVTQQRRVKEFGLTQERYPSKLEVVRSTAENHRKFFRAAKRYIAALQNKVPVF